MARQNDAYMTAIWVAQEARKREGWTTDCAATAANVDTDQRTKADGVARVSPDSRVAADASSPPLTLPWPPSGNSAVRHAQGVHYLRPEVIAYRDSVAHLCAGRLPTIGKYRLHVHLSPPDARRRDADNALKSLLDALVKAGYLIDDSLTYMRELLVTVDDERLGHVRVDVRTA